VQNGYGMMVDFMLLIFLIAEKKQGKKLKNKESNIPKRHSVSDDIIGMRKVGDRMDLEEYAKNLMEKSR
jgi:hypothetical protein